MSRIFSSVLILILFVTPGVCAKQPEQVVLWPDSAHPVLRITFEKFQEASSSKNLRYYTTNTVVENLWTKSITSAEFSVYFFDKDKARIGEGLIMVSNVGPKEVVKFQMGIETSGAPVSLSVSARRVPPELQAYAAPEPPISLTINSVPQGASLKIDGKDSGTTPRVVQLARGKHTLEFEKPGFTPGTFPLEIGPNDTSGGSVSYEMGASAHDTIELRDGSVLVGDLESLTATEAVIRIGGNLQHLNRNSIKQILLTERNEPATKQSN